MSAHGRDVHAKQDGLVALVSPPFYSPFTTPYQIELLSAHLTLRGIPNDLYPLAYAFGREAVKASELAFCKRLVSTRYFGDYLVLARMRPGAARTVLAEMLNYLPETRGLQASSLEFFYRAWNSVVDRFLDDLKARRTRVVGLSATHYQLVSSLYLARRIKEVLPQTKIILGGYMSSLETCRDLLDLHPCLDYVVYGEGEAVLPSLIEDALGDKPRAVVEGGSSANLSVVPRYDSFIERYVAPDGLIDKMSFSFELSRSCYYNQCNFCNFNRAYGKFRTAPKEAVLAEMDRLYARHGVRRFIFLDTSLPPSFAKHITAEGIERPDWDIFCEVLADYTTEEWQALRKVGVRRAQIGIESFSTRHLASMNKNKTLLDNLHALKVCKRLGITAVYGVMIGSPKDRPDFYRDNIDVIGKIAHLEPPRYTSDFDLRAGSPLFEGRETLGVRIEHVPGAFDEVLPAADHNCELRPSRVTYPTLQTEAYEAELEQLVRDVDAWRTGWDASRGIQLTRRAGQWHVIDERGGAETRHALSNTEAELLLALDEPTSIAALASSATGSARDVGETLSRLAERALVLVEDGRAVSLIDRVDTPPRAAKKRSLRLARDMGPDRL